MPHPLCTLLNFLGSMKRLTCVADFSSISFHQARKRSGEMVYRRSTSISREKEEKANLFDPSCHGTVAVAGRCRRCRLRGGGVGVVLLRALPAELFVVRGLEGGHESGGRASRRKRVLRVMDGQCQRLFRYVYWQ
ncbi:hypothetical protein Y032_0120g951 [Ancylostoma ceylanicum]|nr:hypothetical protein Y032_0120g951 [Ancylostoma ceylanicum]